MTQPIELPDDAPPSVGMSVVGHDNGMVSVTVTGRALDMAAVFLPRFAEPVIRRFVPQED
ncbi:MAG: hypothetical protein A2882_16325 [Phenylobacterium sp. RIFCSPHIGHO2_01_FULL_70_10]|nr:MAG: hypothetical protein A2882_16325 [Phenylobacterium sp. RIFCSPHIGHO2_01_FULL_70_10]